MSIMNRTTLKSFNLVRLHIFGFTANNGIACKKWELQVMPKQCVTR